MNNNNLEFVCILDRSGSMHGLEKDTIGGFNSMIEKQLGHEGNVLVTTVLFNNSFTFVHDRTPIEEVELMKEEDFVTSGSTALLDAIGLSIKHISNIYKYIRKEDIPSKTVFLIATDGEENSSSKFTLKQIKNMIKDKKENYGWEFLFLGANIDAVQTAIDYGVDEDKASNYHADAQGTKIIYEEAAKAILNVRTTGKFAKDWNKEIDRDYKNRKK